MRIDHKLLEDLGLADLSQEGKDSLLKHLVDELELSVGTTIAAQLSDEQLDEFEQLVEADDQSAALSWLQANYPDYKQVVQAELEKLKAEIKQNAQAILEADQDSTDVAA